MICSFFERGSSSTAPASSGVSSKFLVRVSSAYSSSKKSGRDCSSIISSVVISLVPPIQVAVGRSRRQDKFLTASCSCYLLPIHSARPTHASGGFRLQVLEMVYEARSGALREFIRLAAKRRLALFFNVHRSLARQSANHAELLRRDEVCHRLGERVAREFALRRSPLFLDDFTLALVQLARDAELHSRAFERIVLGLLDTHLALGCAGADAFSGDAINRDGCGHGNHVADLRDVADCVLPGRGDAIKNVRDRVPLDILDHVHVALAIFPAFAGLDDVRVNLLLESAQGVCES